MLTFNQNLRKMQHIDIEDTFTEIGGQFISSAFDMAKKLEEVKAFVYDWDGVFNAGKKYENQQSTFSEVDAAGLNMLRFGHYLSQGSLPKTAIITGTANPTAHYFSKRDHLDAVYVHAADKEKALYHFCDAQGITPKEVCLIFDDVDDLVLAGEARLRLAVGRLANPVFLHYVTSKGLCDYVSACQGNEHVVREFSELLLSLMGKETETLEKESRRSAEYKAFTKEKQEVSPVFYDLSQWQKPGIGFKPGVN